jgi:hypothetical protein
MVKSNEVIGTIEYLTIGDVSYKPMSLEPDSAVRYSAFNDYFRDKIKSSPQRPAC